MLATRKIRIDIFFIEISDRSDEVQYGYYRERSESRCSLIKGVVSGSHESR
jgi:hypothetical protein